MPTWECDDQIKVNIDDYSSLFTNFIGSKTKVISLILTMKWGIL